jgi:hypothetical protein
MPLSCAQNKEFGDGTGIWSRDKMDGILKNCVISIGNLIINELSTSGYATRCAHDLTRQAGYDPKLPISYDSQRRLDEPCQKLHKVQLIDVQKATPATRMTMKT